MLKLEKVTKDYGNGKGVTNLSFQIAAGKICGLLGSNGCGKTTTFRILLGLIQSDKGMIYYQKKPLTRDDYRLFGYVPEERSMLRNLSVREQITYLARLKKMEEEEIEDALQYWSDYLEITEYMDTKIIELSKGNQQKVQFITAVVHNPELVVLDEPFSGLDPVNTELLRSVIIELVEKGKYIIMSAHQMSVVEEFCTDILILNKGKTVLQGNLTEIKDSYKANKLHIIAKENIEKYIEELNLSIYLSKENEYEINIKEEEEAYKLLDLLVQNKVKVEKFEIKKPSLHDIFIEKVGE